MTVSIRILACVALILSTCLTAVSQKNASAEIVVPAHYHPVKPRFSAKLQAILADAVRRGAIDKGVQPDEIAATLIDLDPQKEASASVRGDIQIYPASVVKLFYMAALVRQIEAGKISPTPELDRGLRDMIVDSSNDATGYILDVLTGTSSGPELPRAEFVRWQYKRNRVNRWVAAMNYDNINVNQKTFCEDAYGVEQQTRNYRGQNRNMLTTDAVARMLAEIVSGRIAGKKGTERMMALLSRDPFSKGPDDDQAHGFTGRLFIDRQMKDARLWSKAGWTSETRHDAAYVETDDGMKFVLVIFTVGHANDKVIIPAIAGHVLDGLRSPSP